MAENNNGCCGSKPAALPGIPSDGPFSVTFDLIADPSAGESVFAAQTDSAGEPALQFERMPDGGLRIALRFDLPIPFSEKSIEGAQAHRDFMAQVARVPYWRMGGDIRTATMYLCIPGYMLSDGATHSVVFTYDGRLLSLYMDGVLIDREGSFGDPAVAADAPVVVSGNGMTLERWEVRDKLVSEEELDQLFPDRARAADELLGPEEPFGQYWRPRGINTSAGDVMTAFDGERLHVIYLRDRRNHASLWSCGAHEFAHWSSPDLVNWTEHPDALNVADKWEGTMGTGGLLYHEGKYYLWANLLSGRLGPAATEKAPPGIIQAISEDGVHFERVPGRQLENGEPGIWFEEETGLFHLLSPGRRMESTDLKNWTLADTEVLPKGAEINNPDEAPTSECYTVFKWNDWFYVIGGRSGFWIGRDIRGPFRARGEEGGPRWSIYDGMMVPMAAVIHDNRCMLIGWVVDYWWGGRLVFRELEQESDGTLSIKWVPEMTPESGEPVALTPASAAAEGQLRLEAADGEMEYMEFPLPTGDCRLSLRLRPAAGCGAFGINIRPGEGYEGGRELYFDPASATARWDTPEGGACGKRVTSPRCFAEDYEIPNVEGLDGEVEVEIILKDWVVDAWINGQRTMLTRSHEATGERVCIFVQSGSLEFDAPLRATL